MDLIYSVFGDSVVQASYVEKSWVELLRTHLEAKFKDHFINVFNLGIGGNTTNDILERIEFEAKFRCPTSIIIGIGVNDSGYFLTPDKPIVEKERFKSNLKKIIKIAKKSTANITFIGLVLGDDTLLQPFPASSKGKSYTKERVLDYDKTIREVAHKNDCKYIYLVDKLNFKDFQDGLHPNESGHKKMFEEIKMEIVL